MGGHLSSQAVGVGDDRLHLFECVLRGAWVVTFREHAAGSTDLDQIRSILDNFAFLVLPALHSIGHTVSLVVIFVGQKIVIAMAAGDAERWTTHQHPWARN